MPLPAYQLITSRYISGSGLILLAPSTTNVYRHIVIYYSVFRFPRQDEKNFKYPNSRGNYANVQYMRSGYVMQTYPIEYEQQYADIYPDKVDGQVLYSAEGFHYQTIQSLIAFAAALGRAFTAVFDAAERPLNTFPDEILVKCRDVVAVQVQLWGVEWTKYSYNNPTPTPPPPTPAVKPPTQPSSKNLFDTPYKPSDPYFPPNDGGKTAPNPIDIPKATDPGSWLVGVGNPGQSPTFATYPGNRGDVFTIQNTRLNGCSLSTSTGLFQNGVYVGGANCNNNGTRASVVSALFTAS